MSCWSWFKDQFKCWKCCSKNKTFDDDHELGITRSYPTQLTPSGLHPHPRDAPLVSSSSLRGSANSTFVSLDPNNLVSDYNGRFSSKPVQFEPLPSLHSLPIQSRRTVEPESDHMVDVDLDSEGPPPVIFTEGDSSDFTELNETSLTIEESKRYKKPDVSFSNISYLFTDGLYILDLPQGTTISQLCHIFPTAIKTNIFGRIGTAQFQTPLDAAHAFHHAQRIKINGEKLRISVNKPEILDKIMDSGHYSGQMSPPQRPQSSSSTSELTSSLPLDNPNGTRRLIKFL